MSPRPALFTEADLRRAIKALLATGLAISAVRIERDGAIRVEIGDKAAGGVEPKTEWRL